MTPEADGALKIGGTIKTAILVRVIYHVCEYKKVMSRAFFVFVFISTLF